MTLTKDDLTIGKKLYKVGLVVPNLFSKKIHMTDKDGVVWHRYPDGEWTYRIIPYIICGHAKVIINGEVDMDSITPDQIFMKTRDHEIHSFEEKDVLDPENHFNFYTDETSAIVAGESICRQKNKLRI
jgi:hypothetical protein